MLLPGGASAATAKCSGKVTFEKPNKPSADLDYSFSCVYTSRLDGFSIVSNKRVGIFQTEVFVNDPTSGEPAEGESFGCEGPIPGFGFGCDGKASPRNEVAGSFSLENNPCKRAERKHPMRFSLVTVSQKHNEFTNLDKYSISEPFKLKAPGCPKLPVSAKKKK